MLGFLVSMCTGKSLPKADSVYTCNVGGGQGRVSAAMCTGKLPPKADSAYTGNVGGGQGTADRE